MSLFATKVRTAFSLGAPNLLRAVNFRLGVRLGWNPVRRLQALLPSGPYFHPPAKERDGALAVPAVWWNEAPYFGHWPVVVGEEPPDWHVNPLSGQRVRDPSKPWWLIPDFDPAVGDIKAVWEASRFDWVLTFAQRAAQGDGAALDRLNRWLADWCVQNPAYYGPNWKCGQETSIRVMHLAMASLILQSAARPSSGVVGLLKAHLQRVAPTMGYAVAQDNNHGTSEAAALYIGGTWLAAIGEAQGPQLAATGRKWLENRVARLIAEDGSFSQYSLTYHRVMLDTLCMVEVWRRYFADSEFSERFAQRAKAATGWLQGMVDTETGDGPNVGANDGARLLPLSATGYRDFRPTVQMAAALFLGIKPYPQNAGVDDQLRWLDVDGVPGQIAPLASQCLVGGGYGILRRRRAFALMRFPRFRFRPSQADALHVDLWVDSENLLRDAGSFGYNIEPRWLDYFSGTKGHNTIQFDDRDQMPRLGKFLFGDWLKTQELIGPVPTTTGECILASYRDRRGVSHKRAITLTDHSLMVEDDVAGFDRKAVLRWRLKPGDWKLDGSTVSCGEHALGITADTPIRRIELVDGWESRYYLAKTPTPVLEIEIDRPGKLVSTYRWI